MRCLPPLGKNTVSDGVEKQTRSHLEKIQTAWKHLHSGSSKPQAIEIEHNISVAVTQQNTIMNNL